MIGIQMDILLFLVDTLTECDAGYKTTQNTNGTGFVLLWGSDFRRMS